MSGPWSKTRKILEEEMLCDSLKGRVQYFLTHYHNAPDREGRFCIRVDGKEYVHANPYNERYSFEAEKELKTELQIPRREWSEKGTFLFDEENRAAEDQVSEQMMTANKMQIYQITEAIDTYLNSDIQKSLYSDNEVVRLFAVLDRRVGKRTLYKLNGVLNEQPEWLRFFYELRLTSEGMLRSTKSETQA